MKSFSLSTDEALERIPNPDRRKRELTNPATLLAVKPAILKDTKDETHE